MSADRLALLHGETLGIGDNVPTGAISNASEDGVKSLFTVVWPRLSKTLRHDCGVYRYMNYWATASPIPRELNDRDLLVLLSTLEAAVAGTDITSPQPDGELDGGTAAPFPEPSDAENHQPQRKASMPASDSIS